MFLPALLLGKFVSVAACSKLRERYELQSVIYCLHHLSDSSFMEVGASCEVGGQACGN